MAPSPSKWVYSSYPDGLTLNETYLAKVTSENQVSLGFPYRGAQNARLRLRTHPRYGKNVFLSIVKGQILVNSYNHKTITMVFDDGKPVTFRVTEPNDGSNETVFFSDYSRFVGYMLKAKTVRIAVPIYQNGAPVFTFDVSGFNTALYLPKK